MSARLSPGRPKPTAEDQSQQQSATLMVPLTVICPVFNEGTSIDEVVARLKEQTHTNWIAIFADGRSTDDTVARLEAAAEVDSRIIVIDNPRRLQSAGLNAAIDKASTDLVVRIDGHSFLEPQYLEKVVDVFNTTDAAVVGGRMVPRPVSGTIAEGVAIANKAAWGAGPARFHGGGEAGPVDTVYLGSFRRHSVEAIGGWAEDVGVNEDYELNYRVRAAGEQVWFDPRLAVGYEPRSTLSAVARQYFRYGKSKLAVLKRHPRSAKPRQVIPALGPLGLIALIVLNPLLALAALAFHAVLLLCIAALTSVRLAPAAAAAAFLMHWSWAIGFWAGIIRPFPPAAEVEPRSAT